MPRLPLIDAEAAETPPAIRDFLNEISRRRGFDKAPNVYRGLANHPGLLHTFYEFYSTAREPDGLTAKECELAYLSASLVNSCYY